MILGFYDNNYMTTTGDQPFYQSETEAPNVALHRGWESCSGLHLHSEMHFDKRLVSTFLCTAAFCSFQSWSSITHLLLQRFPFPFLLKGANLCEEQSWSSAIPVQQLKVWEAKEKVARLRYVDLRGKPESKVLRIIRSCKLSRNWLTIFNMLHVHECLANIN